jgi:hypothetical protein
MRPTTPPQSASTHSRLLTSVTSSTHLADVGLLEGHPVVQAGGPEPRPLDQRPVLRDEGLPGQGQGLESGRDNRPVALSSSSMRRAGGRGCPVETPLSTWGKGEGFCRECASGGIENPVD